MMFEFHSKIVEKLEEQREILTLLSSKKGKRSNETRKVTTAKITTLAPSSSKMVSLTSVALPSKSNWSYSNHSAWSSDYPDCGKENQSPIDLHTVDVSLKDHKTPISFSSS